MALSSLLLCFPLAAGENVPGQMQPFRVRFWADGIEIGGSVPTREHAVRLREALYRFRNRLLLWDELQVAEVDAPFPNTDALVGLIYELDLSTCSGELEITRTAILVSGLTDSLVTQAAFAARLEDLSADGREIRNEICLVGSGQLEDLNLPRPNPPATTPAEPPGDLPSPFVLYNEPFGPEPPPIAGPDRDKLIAFLQEREADSPALATGPPPAPGGLRHLDPMASVEFAPESFLLRTSQVAAVQEAANAINGLPVSALPVILTGYPDNGGQHAFNDWISAQRAREVFELLRGMGVAENRLSLGSYRDHPGNRQGTVTVFAPHPEPVVAAPLREANLAAPE